MTNKPALIPVIVGLPAAGKTSVARAVGEMLGMDVFSTDPFFRRCRALASGSSDPAREIMERFVRRLSSESSVHAAAVAIDARTIDETGQCPLRDGRYFREYGEDVFRLFEIEMLRWLHENGRFSDSIPDLSASAPLYPENRRLFSKANGYCPILLDAPWDSICANLIHDYAAVERARADGTSAVIRGAYETKLDEALQGGRPSSTAERAALLKDVARRATECEASRRMGVYRQYAEIAIEPSVGASPTAIAHALLQRLREH
jgi:shikimate kinase